MYVSAATRLGVDPRVPSENICTEIVDAIRQHGAAAQVDIEELWRRIAFSILISNVDDHLHNHGFLHVAKDQWRLSPAFDINPFPDRQHELKTWISEDAGPAASIDAPMAVAAYFKLDKQGAIRILAEVERTVSAWRVRGRERGMSAAKLEQFADAFEHRERELAQSIVREKRG
jgi:serine/threonine-protein kinase HipA